MTNRSIDSDGAPSAEGYAQAVKISGNASLLFISGQIGMREDGTVPEDFEAQCRLAWKNVKSQLAAADMTVADLVKVNTFLSDRMFAETNGKVRLEMLEGNRPANSSMVATILDGDWLLEIEAIASR